MVMKKPFSHRHTCKSERREGERDEGRETEREIEMRKETGEEREIQGRE